MLAKKLVLIAAAIAVALSPAAASSHHNINCPGGSPMSVEGANGVYCVYGAPCSGQNFNGACPASQPGLESGAFCGPVNGVAGCKKHAAHKRHHKQVVEDDESSDDSDSVSDDDVEDVEYAHYHKQVVDEDSTDSADSTDSTDSYEGSDESYDSYDSEDASNSTALLKGLKTGSGCTLTGGAYVSVEGVADQFCVYGQACVANINGACPGPQTGLEHGSSCGTVLTGAYGCKPNSSRKQMKKALAMKASCPGGSSMSVEGVAGSFCVYGQACVGTINGSCPGPQSGLEHGAYCGTVKTGVMGCKLVTSHKHHKKVEAQKIACPGGSPMSVEGVSGAFCVYGQACVSNINGACPGPQPGLANGASCGIVRTGVYGCKPN